MVGWLTIRFRDGTESYEADASYLSDAALEFLAAIEEDVTGRCPTANVMWRHEPGLSFVKLERLQPWTVRLTINGGEETGSGDRFDDLIFRSTVTP